MIGMDINTMASWVGVLWMAVFPTLIWAARHILRSITSMDKELRNNGGSSMRDAIDRIEESLERLEHQSKKNRKQIKKIKGELDQHIQVR